MNIRNKNTSSKEETIDVSGVVVDSLPSASFRVQLDNGHIIIAHTAGRIRKKRIKILNGDKVTVQMTMYDKNRGRIVYREKS